MVALIELLTDELAACAAGAPDGAPRQVVLWLDPAGDFFRLWPHLASPLADRSLRPIACERATGDQLGLKLALLRLETERTSRAVVYLPGYSAQALNPHPDGTSPELWSIYEFRFKGAFWTLTEHPEPGSVPAAPTLLGWLTSHGVQLADEGTATRLAEGGGDSLLARYAELNRNRPPAEWPRPLKESEVIAALGGDPRDALAELLAAPGNAMRLWGERAPLALSGIEAAFGLRCPTGDPAPEAVADTFAAQLALTEAWDAFGRTADFPFRTRLAERAEQRDRSVHFLRNEVLKNVDLGPRYRERLLRVEKDLNLSRWAVDRAGQPRGLPLLARQRWNAFLTRFNALAEKDWRQARDLLLQSASDIAAGRTMPWDQPDGDTQWFVLDAARELAEQCATAVQEAVGLRRAWELVAAYTGRWWQADRLHLRVRAACSRISGLEHVRRVADLAYFAYADAVNDRLSSFVEEEKSWPPEQTQAAASIAGVLWDARAGRVGVVVSDGLRWDLAKDLSGTLPVELSAAIATLPTTTPFGMSALLPLAAAEIAVTLEGGVALRVKDGPDLATRDGRKKFLAAAVPSRTSKPAVGFIDLDQVLRGERIPVTPIVVVFDNTIDEQGHKGTEELPGLAEQLISKLRRTIECLHENGIPTVHVVTDHGFLLLPSDMVNGLGRPTVNVGQVLRRETRWCALKADAPVTGLIRVPVILGQEQAVLGFPRGVRTLLETEDYFHGGISLQEAVIPHAVSSQPVRPARLDVEVRVAASDLVTGTIPVVISPMPEGLFGQQSAHVRLWVERASPRGAGLVTEPVEVEVRADAAELRPPMYLKEGSGIRAGTQLVLHAVDSENGRQLAAIPLRMSVDWD